MDDYSYFKRILNTIPSHILEPKQTPPQEDHFNKSHNSKKKFKEQVTEQVNAKQRPHIKEHGKMIFSKFELASSDDSKLLHKKGKSKERLLKSLLEKQEKLQKLAQKDMTKATELVEKDEWEKASKRARGIKVKDNANLLSKSIQRQEGKKKSSKKSWEERVDKKKEEQKQKKKQRHENIVNLKKRKRNRPGFEGVHLSKSKKQQKQ